MIPDVFLVDVASAVCDPSAGIHLTVAPATPVPHSFPTGVADVCSSNLVGNSKIATPATPVVDIAVPLVNDGLGEVDVDAKPVAKIPSATPTSPGCTPHFRWAVDVDAKRGANNQSATPTPQATAPHSFPAAPSLVCGCILVSSAPPSSLLILSTNTWEEAQAWANRSQS